MADTMLCYQCGQSNPSQAFCGSCGAPLILSEYISRKVKDQVEATIQNRDVLERDSSIKVFQQAWNWIKLIIGIAAGLLILAGGGVIWKASDFWSGVDKAKQSVTDAASNSSKEISNSAAQSKRDISAALDAGKSTIKAASEEASQQAQILRTTASHTKTEITQEGVALRSEIDKSRGQLQVAEAIRPEMEKMRDQLSQATTAIQSQQKVISSSEDFVKSVFSSHMVETFDTS
ncbi:MAG: zinc ribbon domain-containing protein, partial [Terriglobales bacterium]